MKRISMVAMQAAAFALAGGGLASGANAQQSDVKKTPKSWDYVIKDGKRVPKADRVTNADGSWREEIRKGNCVTTKAMSADGVYKETHRCD